MIWSCFALPDAQYRALESFYESTNGYLWYETCSQFWNFTGNHDPCTEMWHGIQCFEGNISLISLSDCNISGSLPSQIGDLHAINTMTLSYNQIGGAIPSSFENLTLLSFLDMSYCFLTGHIPTLPSSLYSVELRYNFLSGPIPTLSGEHMITLSLSNNYLTGTVPPLTIPTMRSILDLSLHDNMLTGVFPGPWGDSIQHLKLYNNFLHGPLSPTNCTCAVESGSCALLTLILSNNLFSGDLEFFSGLTGVSTIEVTSNLFTGPLPSSITTLSKLDKLDMSNNFLAGSPFNAFLIPKIRSLYLSANRLSGSLDLTGVSSTRLAVLDLSDNLLSGQVQLGSILSLIYMDLSSNALSGPLPSLRGVQYIQQITLSQNHFTGTIHNDFYSAELLKLLDLSGNHLQGTIPPALFTNTLNRTGGLYSSMLNYLFLQDNSLTGTIPSQVGLAGFLRQIALYQNSLSGTLPMSLRNNTQLQSLLLQKNDFSGSPDELFQTEQVSDPSLFPLLQVLDLSRNHFTGAIPRNLFALPSLIYVAVIDGCFTGTLPADICEATHLQTLVLEGLHSGSSCRRRIKDVFHNRQELLYVSRAFGGTIPSCIWNMTNLRTLHLSGNLLEGSLPSSYDTFAVQDLSLSYNRLTGTIPVSLIENEYLQRVDVSHNKLIGDVAITRENDEKINSKLVASVNRLSGPIPTEVESFAEVDILHGNLFNCGSKSDLPRTDPEYDHYVCGSDELDSALLVWGSICTAYAFALAGYMYLSHRVDKLPHPSGGGSNASISTAAANVKRLCAMLTANARIVHSWNRASLHVNSTLNPSLEAFLVTLRALRRNVLTLTGVIVALFMTFYLTAKLCFHWGTHSNQYRWLPSAAFLSGKTAAVIMLVLLLVVLTFLVSGIYVLDTRHKERMRDAADLKLDDDDFFSTAAAYSYAMHFKAYSYIVLVLLINCSVVLGVKGAFVYVTLWTNISPFIQGLLQFLLSGFDIMWNGVVLTKCITFGQLYLQSKTRIRLHLLLLLFNSIFAPVIATGFTARSCFAEIFTGVDIIETNGVYSLCATVNAKGECIDAKDLKLSTTFVPPYTYSYQCSSSVFKSFLPVFILSYSIRAFVQPLLLLCLMYVIKSDNNPIAITMFPSILWPTRSHRHELRKVMLPGAVVTHLLHDIAVMATFGVVSPLCCIVVAVSVCCSTLLWNIVVGRYLLIKSRQSMSCSSDTQDGSFDSGGVVPINTTSVSASHMALEKACRGVWQGPMNAVWIIVDTACVFFSLVFIDIAGDGMGALQAFLKISLPTLSITIALRFCFHVFLAVWPKLSCFGDVGSHPMTDSAVVSKLFRHSGDHPAVWTTSPIVMKDSQSRRIGKGNIGDDQYGASVVKIDSFDISVGPAL